MLTIATIGARGGSQGVPGKNVRNLLGKPLIVWTIEQALEMEEIDGVYITTDSEDIAKIARDAGAIVPFLRPSQLATNTSAKLPAIEHLVTWVEQNVGEVNRVVDLDATSPLRETSDIQKCMLMLDHNTDLVITGYEADKNPYFNMVEQTEDSNWRLVKTLPNGIVRRQDAPVVYSMNASIYVWQRHALATGAAKGLWNGRIKLHVMPHERSIDIDNPIDFQLVEILMRNKLMKRVKTTTDTMPSEKPATYRTDPERHK